MKKQYLLLFVLFLSFSLEASQKASDQYFYYYQGEKFHLQIDYSRISVVSNVEIDSVKIETPKGWEIKFQRKSYTRQNVILLDQTSNTKGTDTFISEIELSGSNDSIGYFNTIRQLQKTIGIVKISPTYTVMGQKLGISNNFYAKLSDAGDVDKLHDLAKKYFIRVLGYNEFMPLWYTLSCTDETPFDALEAANLFYETQLFESAEPEFLYYNLLASNDQYFPNQWGLKNTGQHCNTPNVDIDVERAWNLTTGSSNIRVAVYDTGIKMDHPDLQANIYGTGYDAVTGTSPSQIRGVPFEFHGTRCAGIVGAVQNNAIGISGVSPSSKLISISMELNENDTPQQIANGFNWAWQNGADIISNSWGGYNPSSIIDDAITEALTRGRSQKGAVIIFAAGNEDDTNIRYPGNSNPDILVVGAISPDGKRKSLTSCDGELWGSCYGTQLDIMAPGVKIPTTNLYQNGYVQDFYGTSSACPHVAGVAALMLSVNPSLTAQQIRDIIESSAQKVGDYDYQTTFGRPNGTWYNEMGYGLINAYYATLIASTSCTNNDFVNQVVTSNTTVMGCSNLNVQNVTVVNGAKLKLDAPGAVIIDGPFETQNGSELEVR
ncbi:MAG: S8 family serine peptidase [Dysgonamonadaceae bacterium]|jgi:subtilisin family serine protease|nr:S8 family serine peptidase [Dysgonamonadaceae bacterium]